MEDIQRHEPQKVAEVAQKQVYDVQIAGVHLKLRSSHDSGTVSNLIQLVDQKVKEAMAANATVSFQNALILATLNLAEELLLLKNTANNELERIEERTRRILDQIEEVTGPAS